MNHQECVLTTAFDLLRAANACTERYRVLAKALGGIKEYGAQTPIPISVILETNGLDDALWALCAVQPEQKETCERLARMFACDCAERVMPLYEAEHPADTRPRRAIDAARRYARGEISADELAAARDAALDAALDAARAAALDAALDAAWAAARDAALAAALDAAWAAARAAARDAALAAARDAERECQRERLLYYLFEHIEAQANAKQGACQ